jgi:hypothetical protein
MKRSIYLAVGILFSALFYSCELLPDLNPNTSEGANILILDVNDVLIYPYTNSSGTKFVVGYKSYQISNTPFSNGNSIKFGETCIYISICLGPLSSSCDAYSSIIDATGGVLSRLNSEVGPIPYILNNLQSSTALGAIFAPTTKIAKTCYTGRNSSEFFIPNGIKYVMFKHIINGATHYGWVEFETNLNFNNITGQCIIKRIALAQQPGYVLRAGQTE